MNKTGALKFTHENEKGVMHYTTFNNELVALSVFDSKKVVFVTNGGKLDICFNLKGNDFESLAVEVVTDPKFVEEVYNYMLAEDNTYYKDGFEGLCVLKLLK